MPTVKVTAYDDCPSEESALLDNGLGQFNDSAAPIQEVQSFSCFAKAESGQLIGGAVGRRWGQCCELQQLWVETSYRRHGIGADIVRAFEAHASKHGCNLIYLETFSFQAPEFYKAMGYKVEHERSGFPHNIVKYQMAKHINNQETAA